MKKLSVSLYAATLLSLTLYGLLSHSYYVQILINLSSPYVLVRCLIVAMLVLYAFVPQVRLHSTKTFLGMSGTALLIVGLMSICSPTLLGYSTKYVLLGDTITMLEGGILGVVLSAELPIRHFTRAMETFYVLPQLKLSPRHLSAPSLNVNASSDKSHFEQILESYGAQRTPDDLRWITYRINDRAPP